MRSAPGAVLRAVLGAESRSNLRAGIDICASRGERSHGP